MYIYMLRLYAECSYRASTSLNCQDECALLQYSNGENGQIMIKSNPRHSPNTCPTRRTRNRLSTLLYSWVFYAVVVWFLLWLIFPYAFLVFDSMICLIEWLFMILRIIINIQIIKWLFNLKEENIKIKLIFYYQNYVKVGLKLKDGI